MPLQKTEETAAGEMASRLISQVNITVNGIKQMLEKGAPENKQLGNPAVSAAAVKNALGATAVAQLEALVTAVA